MTFEQYWAIFIKHWRLIVLCFLFMGAGTAIGSRLMTRLYQSSALVQVNVGTDSAYTSLLASNEVVQTEATLATGDSVLREVASHYKGLTVDRLAKEVTAAPKLNTQLFSITVLDPDPNQAAVLANDVATTLVKQQFDLTRQGPVQMNLLVVQQAQPDFKPAQPNVLLNTCAGLLFGLLLGLVLAVLSEKLDTRIRSSEAISQSSGWPLLTTIWKIDASHGNMYKNGMNLESYRMLRTNLEPFYSETSLQTMMITSAFPEDGRTTVAMNLAIVMAKAGKNTLLVDADLHHSAIAEHFTLAKDAPGLSNALLSMSPPAVAGAPSPRQLLSQPDISIENISLETFIYTANVSHLWIMPAGSAQSNASELLASKGMHHLLQAFKSYAFDVVLFDTPPLLGLSDGSILASKVDGVLVVIDAARANKGVLQQMHNLLSQRSAHLVGYVMNKQPFNGKDRLFATYSNNTEEDIDTVGTMSAVPLTDSHMNDMSITAYYRDEDEKDRDENEEKEPVPAIELPTFNEREDQPDSSNSQNGQSDYDATSDTIKLNGLMTGKGRKTNHAI